MSWNPFRRSRVVEPKVYIGEPVKIVGGKYNGLKGNVTKVCDQFCGVRIEWENKMFEEVVETKFLTPLSKIAAS